MQFTSKLSPEQWAEARRLRAGGATCKDIAERFELGESTVSRRALREGWPGPAGSAPPRQRASASPAAGIRSRLALRLYRVIESKVRILELCMHRQLQAHLEAGAAAPPPPGKDERDSFAALIASINQVTEMASEPAAQGRRKAATGPVNRNINPELTALSDDIDLGGLAVASEKDQYRRELAEHLGKLFPKP